MAPFTSTRPRSTGVRSNQSSFSMFGLMIQIAWLPIYLTSQMFLLFTSIVLRQAISLLPHDLSEILKDAVQGQQSPLTLPSFKLPAPAPAPIRSTSAPVAVPRVSLEHDEAVQLVALPHIIDSVPHSHPAPLAEPTDTPKRRPRPANYHGSSLTPIRPNANPLQLHGRTHSGGIRPLHLPIKVASAASSPKLEATMTLDSEDEDEEYNSSNPKSLLGTRTMERSSEDGDRHWPRTAPAGRTRFQLEDINTSPRDEGVSTRSAENSPGTGVSFVLDDEVAALSRHRRMASEQTFAQHEREALLTRIAELELALQQRLEGGRESPAAEHSGSRFEAGDTPQPGSRYPSPPMSPAKGVPASPTPKNNQASREVEDIHEMRVLEDTTPTHPQLRLISPTLFTQERHNSTSTADDSTEESENYFGNSGADEVASPTSANV